MVFSHLSIIDRKVHVLIKNECILPMLINEIIVVLRFFNGNLVVNALILSFDVCKNHLTFLKSKSRVEWISVFSFFGLAQLIKPSFESYYLISMGVVRMRVVKRENISNEINFMWSQPLM